MEKIKNILKIREMTSFLCLVALFVIVGIVNPTFLQLDNILNCLNGAVIYTLLATGIAFVILVGEIDCSIGATLCMCAAICCSMIRDGSSFAVAIIAAVAVGALIGLFNGWGVAVLQIPSLIFTVGVMGTVRGLVYVYTNCKWVENLPPYYTQIAQVKVGGLTGIYIFALAVALIAYVLTTRTRQGKYFIAVGDNASGANLVGIPATRVKVLAYVLCGVFAAVAGIVYGTRVGFIQPSTGNGYEMTAIAACVLGGLSLNGGVGSILGSAIGAIIISSISRLLVFVGLSSNYNDAITGIVLIAIVVFDAVSQSKKAAKNRQERLLARTASLEGGKAES